MTLKNNRGPLPCYFKHYASFPSHWWIQTGVTVRKRPIWVKIDDFFSCVTTQFDVWPWKTIGHLFYSTSCFVHHFISIWEFKLQLRSGNGLSLVLTSVTLTFDLWPWPFAWTPPLSMVITPVKFMMIRLVEHNEKGVTDRNKGRKTDGPTDGRTYGRTEVFLKLLGRS